MIKKITINIPVYNNAGSLELLHTKICEDIITVCPEYDYEIIMTDDGSKDHSWEVMTALANKDSRVKIIKLSKNFGQQYAWLAGWNNSTGDVLIDMAADLQDPPMQCVNMIREWEQGNTLVISYRQEHATNLCNKVSSRLFFCLLIPEGPKTGFDFVLFDRKVLNILLSFKDKNRFYQKDILSLGFSPKYIPYIKEERVYGKSQWTFKKRLQEGIRSYLSVSYFPLRATSILGFSTATTGVIYAIIVFISYSKGITPLGWTSLMVCMLILGGFTLFSIGLLGEYIWRMYDEIKGRPNFIIEDIIQKDKE